MLKFIFSIIVFSILWFVIYALILALLAAIGIWDPSGRIGSIPGITGIASIFLSYRILKRIHKIPSVHRFFSEKSLGKRD
jgi:hypothetical protein